MKSMFRQIGMGFLWVSLCGIQSVRAEDARTTLSVNAPIPRQVLQRDAKDQAVLTIQGKVNVQVDSIEAKVELVEEATRCKGSDWIRIAGTTAPGVFSAKLTLQAGGWYKLSVRAMKGTHVTAEATIDKVGVGEVFVTAGQSNSANFGTPRQKAKEDRVVYYDGRSYIPAEDPIPGGCGDGGSVWSILGDRIVESQGVPVCFRSASLTWTEVKNWMPPDTQLYKNLVQCVNAFGTNGVRAVLWHQGESDTLVKTSAAVYRDRLKAITIALNRDCGYRLPWFVAQASFHTGSGKPEQEEVAKGQQMLWAEKIAFKGAVTDDLLTATYRSDGVHFNQAGLHAHAERWFGALKAQYGWKGVAGKPGLGAGK